MKATVRLALAGLMRSPGTAAVRVVVLAAAVALLGSMILFIDHSLRTMTGAAVRSVPLDWQGPVAANPQARQVAAGVGAQPGIEQASAAATAPFAGVSHSGDPSRAISALGDALIVNFAARK